MPGVGRNKRSALRRRAVWLRFSPSAAMWQQVFAAKGAGKFDAVGDFGEA